MRGTVLVVDDERQIVELLADILSDEGFAVRKAYDGLTALQEAEIAPPDLVLSDIAMPGLNGIELASRLRERRIPVVLLSAAMADPRLAGVPYLAKPFDLEQLLSVVSQHVRRAAPTNG